MSGRDRSDFGIHVHETHRIKVRDHRHHRGQHAHVADTVHDERLVRRRGVSGDLVPESDEEVRSQAHTFPADEKHGVGVREDEGEHRGDKEIEVSEEAPTVSVVLHVSDGVHVDE